MKVKIPTTKEVDVRYVKMILPVNYEDEDIPYNFPLRCMNEMEMIVEISTGKVGNWPKGYTYNVFMKVVDEGVYILLDERSQKITTLSDCYVPHGLIPGEYGDYVDLKINGEGIITNWPKCPSFEDFFDSYEN